MKKSLAVVALLVLASCGWFKSPTDHSQNVFVNVNPPPTASPSPVVPGACPVVKGAVLAGPDQLAVGASAVLDLSPQTLQPNSKECDDLRVVKWSASGPCTLSGSRPFNPNLLATGRGTCKVKASVDGVDSNEIAVLVP